MVETGTFPNGILNGEGVACRDFTLAERTFRCSLDLAHDADLDQKLLRDPVYYDAAVISRRLKVAGIDRLTPEMVLDLEGDDGDTLAGALMSLDQRREEFRSKQQTAAQAAAGADQTGSALE